MISPGQGVVFCGSGFRPGSTVTITVGTAFYETVHANAGGTFCATVRLTSAGQYVLRATGIGRQGEVRIVSATVTVRASTVSGSVASGSTSGGSLPFTGAEVGLMAAGAALLIGAGTGARFAGRRRRSTAA